MKTTVVRSVVLTLAAGATLGAQAQSTPQHKHYERPAEYDRPADPGKPVAEGGAGYSCIAEIRMIETIASGEAKTRFMAPGDRVAIWMEDESGHSIFGKIEQQVVEA